MKETVGNLELEKAALLSDRIFELRRQLEGEDMPEWERVWKESTWGGLRLVSERARDRVRVAVL